MRAHFKAWLKQKYDTVAALQESWNDPELTFETAHIPTKEERLGQGDDSFFLNCTPVGNKIADYYTCYDEALADLALHYCQVIKESLPSNKLVGLMHAASYGGRYEQTPHHHGQSAAQKILSSPHVDYVHSAYHYYNRSIGGTHYSQHAVDSVKLHGKLMIDQIDTKTHLYTGSDKNASTAWETEQLLKRDAAYAISKNVGCYWFEGGHDDTIEPVKFSPGMYSDFWYDDPKITQLFAQLNHLQQQMQEADHGSASEVALFVSSEASVNRKLEDVHGKLYVDAFRQWIMPGTSVPFDDYLLEDFPELKKSYKVYIFLNAHHVPAALREQIRASLTEQKATALWFYAPGYNDESGCDIAHMRELTGINLKVDEGTADYLHVDLQPSGWTKGVSSSSYGTQLDPALYQEDLLWKRWPQDPKGYQFTPSVYAEDAQAEVLGTLTGSNRAGLVTKTRDGATDIWSMAPLLPTALLRNFPASWGSCVFRSGRPRLCACWLLGGDRQWRGEQREPCACHKLLLG